MLNVSKTRIEDLRIDVEGKPGQFSREAGPVRRLSLFVSPGPVGLEAVGADGYGPVVVTLGELMLVACGVNDIAYGRGVYVWKPVGGIYSVAKLPRPATAADKCEYGGNSCSDDNCCLEEQWDGVKEGLKPSLLRKIAMDHGSDFVGFAKECLENVDVIRADLQDMGCDDVTIGLLVGDLHTVAKYGASA